MQFRISFVLILTISLVSITQAQETGQSWYRGNLHTHSLWSDGDDFPDMIVKWYVENDYQFLALTDHNVLSNKERWMSWKKIKARGGETVLPKYLEAFGEDWVETRGSEEEGNLEIRLRKFSELVKRFNEPEKFRLIAGEEISDSVNGRPLHLNATNLKHLLRPVGGASMREAMDNNLRAASEQARKENRRILVHLNHPNFGWAVTAEDLAAVTREKFVEVYNGHPGVNHLGDRNRPSVERIWDIANTIRIAELNSPPLFGLATDDSHYYHGRPGSHTGRGWIMVRANELKTDPILKSIEEGNFYASSGVFFNDVSYDPQTRKLALDIAAKNGVTYTTQFIGTMKGYDDSSEPRVGSDGKSLNATRAYSKDLGKILATETGAKPSFQLTGNELYVRAVVTSSEPHPDPSFKEQKEQAWTQPVGWRAHVEN